MAVNKAEKQEVMQELSDLYRAYCDELAAFDNTKYPPGQAELTFTLYRDDPVCTIKQIAVNGKTAGFLIIMDRTPKHLIIAEAYLKPEYRKQGWMRFAVENTLLYGDYLTIALATLNRNTAAFPYWKKTLALYNYKFVDSEPYNAIITDYYFKKEEKGNE